MYIEYFDVLDVHGKAIGDKKTRADVHMNGDWHRSVHVWVINSKNEVLIQKRAMVRDTGAGAWDISCAGHLSAGDTAEDGAVRELEEELGVVVDSNQLIHLFSIKRSTILNNGTHIDNEFNEIFVIRIDQEASEFILQEEEVDECKFVPFNKLEEYLDVSLSSSVLSNLEYKNKLFAGIKNLMISN